MLVLKLTTVQPRKTCFKANYRIAEAGLLKTSYKGKKAGGDGGFTVSLQ